MTKAFDALLESPQTRVQLGDVDYDERMLVRRIDPSAGRSVTSDRRVGRFTAVAYLEGNEREAARVFVEENRELLDEYDSLGAGRNVLESSLDRAIYDWVLHELGIRRLEPFGDVVVEYRPDEDVTWCIEREAFVDVVARRYTEGMPSSNKLDGTLSELFIDLLVRYGGLDREEVPEGERPGIASDTKYLPKLRLDEPAQITDRQIGTHRSIANGSNHVIRALVADPRFDAEFDSRRREMEIAGFALL